MEVSFHCRVSLSGGLGVYLNPQWQSRFLTWGVPIGESLCGFSCDCDVPILETPIATQKELFGLEIICIVFCFIRTEITKRFISKPSVSLAIAGFVISDQTKSLSRRLISPRSFAATALQSPTAGEVSDPTLHRLMVTCHSAVSHTDNSNLRPPGANFTPAMQLFVHTQKRQ